MKQAYMIVRLYIHEEAWIADYLENVPPMLRSFGGEYIVSSPKVERIEGEDALPDFVTVFRFPSMRSIHDFIDSPEYKPYRDARLAGASASIFLVEAD
jgi:uncharacterized protein (DUF1330 family)